MTIRVLVVDDEPGIRAELEEALQEAGYSTQSAGNGHEALELARHDSFDLCISDIRMPVMAGTELLRKLGETSPETMVILMTAYAELDTAIEALRLGAVDYLLKPFKHEELIAKVRRLAEYRRLVLENRNLRRFAENASKNGGHIVGKGAAMAKILEAVDRVASMPSHVMVTGETGTGKDLVAHAIHERGSRAKSPFVPINCAAIPETLLESELFGHVRGAFTGATDNKEGLLKTAGDGSIFLDELGEMPLPIQAKLLRAIETREIQPLGWTRRVQIHARFIVATNRDLLAEARAGRFREDLYYRLAVVEIRVPALRDRREDIPLLAEYFVRKFSAELGRSLLGISHAALRLLAGHEWRGNIRELSNAIERAVIFSKGTEIEPADLPDAVRAADPKEPGYPTALRDATADFEREHILRVIAQCDGNKRRAAKLLGLGVTTLYRKLGAAELETIEVGEELSDS